MKTKLMTQVMILTSLFVFSACPGKNDSNTPANVVGPQGRIVALSSSNTYCDISAGTIMCSTIDPQSGRVCNSNKKVYNQQDMGSFCQQMNQLKYEATGGFQPCDTSAAIDRILNESCKGIATPGNPNNPFPNNPNPGNPNPNPGYPGYPNQPAPGYIQCNVKYDNNAELRIPLTAGNIVSSYTHRFFRGFFKTDLKVFLKYAPRGNNCDETTLIEISREKDDRKTLARISGFAGQPVKIDAIDNGNHISVSCVDSRNARNSAPIAMEKNLVCHGETGFLGTRQEVVDVNRPMNSIVSGEDLQITRNLRIKIDKTKSTITYKALLDDTFGPDIEAVSSLRTESILNSGEGREKEKDVTRDGMGRANIKCSLK